MSDDVFYTKYKVPEDTALRQISLLLDFLTNCRSVAGHQFSVSTSELFIIVANRFSSLKYSDCPLPGSHDFAAGWLAHDAMMKVSQYLNESITWTEAEYYKDHPQQHMVNNIRDRRDKPKVIVSWVNMWEEENETRIAAASEEGA